jgi:hypothetical protein
LHDRHDGGDDEPDRSVGLGLDRRYHGDHLAGRDELQLGIELDLQLLVVDAGNEMIRRIQ